MEKCKKRQISFRFLSEIFIFAVELFIKKYYYA